MSSEQPAPAPVKRTLRQRLKGYAGKLLLLLITCTICLLLLEVAVRYLFPYYNPQRQVLFERNAEGVVLGVPSTSYEIATPKGDWNLKVSNNRHGFRDVKDYTQSTTNDVFASGDSYTFGWGVQEEERYSNVVEKNQGVRVFNIAIPEDIRGYAHTLEFVKKNGARVGNLMIGICMENDLWDYYQAESKHVTYHKQMVRGPYRRMAVWFKGHSALWTAASHIMQSNPAMRHFLERVGIARDIDTLTHKNEYTPDLVKSSSEEVVKIATNYNSVILIIPSRALWAGQNTEAEKKVHQEFVQALRTAGLEVIDMKPIFEKGGNPSQYYFTTDPHWNAAGHAVAAAALGEFFAGSEKWKFARPAAKVP